MHLTLVMVARPFRPGRPAESVLQNPPQKTALSKWSHEHWLLAGMFGVVGTALIAIVPGFANATHESVDAVAPNQLSLALPLPASVAQDNGSASGWQIVRIRSGETLGTVFAQLKLSPSLMHRMLDETSSSTALTHPARPSHPSPRSPARSTPG